MHGLQLTESIFGVCVASGPAQEQTPWDLEIPHSKFLYTKISIFI